MWIIQEQDGTLHDRGNLPSHNLLPALLEQFPDATIYRSKKPCHNEFGALAFAKEWVQDGEREYTTTDAEGNEATVTEPVMVLKRVENTYAIEQNMLVVRDKVGELLGQFEMEVVFAPQDSTHGT